MLDAPWVEDGKFTRVVAPADGASARRPDARRARRSGRRSSRPAGTLGTGRPYAIDTIEPPFDNPWKALLFFGDHDFLPDGTGHALHDAGGRLARRGARRDARPRPLAAVRLGPAPGARPGRRRRPGLRPRPRPDHPAARPQRRRRGRLLRVREQRLRDLRRRPRLHLRPPARRGGQLLHGLGQAGAAADLPRRQDGRGPRDRLPQPRRPRPLAPTASLTVPSSEGEWTPASMVCEVRPGGHYGYGGPEERPAARPAARLPAARAGQLERRPGRSSRATAGGRSRARCSTSPSARGRTSCCSARQVDGQPQGAVVPLPGEFLSGVHRGRFNPKDGQLYVSGMAGWGTYTPLDGCFQRVRYTGDPVQLPVAFHAHENGVLVTFSRPARPRRRRATRSRTSPRPGTTATASAYGSPELSPRHPGTPGHDPLAIRSAHVLADGRTLFLEIPDLQPVNQLHLHLRVDAGPPLDLFATVHKLAAPFTGFPGYRPGREDDRRPPDPRRPGRWRRKPVPNPLARSRSPAPGPITIEAGKNLTLHRPLVHRPRRRADQAHVHQPRRRAAQLGA